LSDGRLKGFDDDRFFNLVARLQADTNSNPTVDQWQVDGVDWLRERHSHWGRNYAFQFECQTLIAGPPQPWRLLVVTEKRWDSNRLATARLVQWSKLTSGGRHTALEWFRKHERRLEARETSGD
jgi:hypothetical protein